MAKNKNGERKQNTGHDIVIGLILPFVSVLIEAISLPYKLFCIIFLVFLVIVFLTVLGWQIFSYTKRIEEKIEIEYEKTIINENSKTDGSTENIESEIRENKRRFHRECREEKISFVKRMAGCSAALFISIVLLFLRLSVISTDGNDGTPVNTDNPPVVINVNNMDQENSNDGITPEQIEEMEKKTFILIDPNKLIIISNEDEKDIFYISDTDKDTVVAEVEAHNAEIFAQNKRSTVVSGSDVKYIAENAQGLEDDFLAKINSARAFKNQGKYEDWLNELPSSDDLDQIIEGRERLWRPQEENMEFDGNWCIRLANNMQLYAEEYMLQGGRPETVVYFEVQAIKWTERGLAYEDLPVDNYDKYYKYIKARYKDISDYIQNNLDGFGDEKEKYQQIKENAYAIYNAM